MNLKTFLLLLISFVFSTHEIVIAQDDFELVQSIPSETNLIDTNLSNTLDVWLKMINDANSKINIETFYFANKSGEPLEQVIEALKNAALRGVEIRIIVDSSFYANNEKSVDILDQTQNITIRKFPVGNISGGVMHAKFFIVDNKNLFIGSQNMDWRSIKHIHEIGVRVMNDDLAGMFNEIFETDWRLCEGSYWGLVNQGIHKFVNLENPVTINSDEYGKIILYPAFSPPEINMAGLNSEEDELIKIITNAGKRLYIQIYSYSPRKQKENSYIRIDSALRVAAAKGVDIRIIFPDWAIRESSIDFIKDLSLVKNIQIKFISFSQHSSGFIPYSRVDHSKYFIADDNLSWISTSNWEWGYFNNSRNATLIINSEKINNKLSELFNGIWEGSYVEFIDVGRKYETVKRN